MDSDGDFLAEVAESRSDRSTSSAASTASVRSAWPSCKEWRGRGVGSALLGAAIEWARSEGLHKLSLSVFAHNEAAIALYRKLGFVEEGRLVKHYRRQSGEFWDAIQMGLLLED